MLPISRPVLNASKWIGTTIETTDHRYGYVVGARVVDGVIKLEFEDDYGNVQWTDNEHCTMVPEQG